MIYLKILSKTHLFLTLEKQLVQIKDDGGCQCFHDCNCSSTKGVIDTVTHYVVLYKGIKRFDNLQEAIDHIGQVELNRVQVEECNKIALNWFNNLSIKDKYKAINTARRYNKSSNKLKHAKVCTDTNQISVIYRTLLKNNEINL